MHNVGIIRPLKIIIHHLKDTRNNEKKVINIAMA
jgi:hypothetical protein